MIIFCVILFKLFCSPFLESLQSCKKESFSFSICRKLMSSFLSDLKEVMGGG